MPRAICLVTAWALAAARLVVVPLLLVKVATVAARAWIATGILCCSRAMYVSLAIETLARQDRFDMASVTAKV